MAWNKGLTKSDPRVKKYSDKLKGRILTQAWKDKIRLAHQGKKASPLHRKKIKDALTGRHRTKEERLHISLGMKGRKFSNETKQKMRLAKLGNKLPPSHRAKIMNSWTKDMRVAASKRRSTQTIPLKHTSIEKEIQLFLTRNNIRYKTSYPINLGFMIHQADIFVKPNKIIELFGTYHHADPFRFAPDHILKVKGHSKASDIWKADHEIISAMKQEGFEVLVIWQNDLKIKPNDTKQKILDFIKKRI